MISVCAWCQKMLGEKEPLKDLSVSHGICPECLAKQQRDIKKMEKRKAIWKSGQRMEKKFFGPRGVFARSRAKQNPDVPEGIDLFAYMRQEGWTPQGGRSVKAFYRLANTLYQVVQKEARAWRLLQRSALTAASDPILSVSTFPTLEQALIGANREASLPAQNPLAVFSAGNPAKQKRPLFHRKQPTPTARALGVKRRPAPARKYTKNPSVSAGIAGVVYNRCVELRAEKTGYKPGLYRHPFSKKSRVQILALDNGDLLIHSQAGIKLWGRDT